MHDANGLTFLGWLLYSVCGIVLLALACTLLAYLLVRFSTEDRHAMDRLDQAAALFAQKRDDKERCDDANPLGVVSTVRLDLTRDLTRRAASPSLAQRRAEIREGRPFPPAA
jgi:hypothetical protein